MERVCFLLQVRPEKLEEYVQRHQEVWPEMLEALSRAGWGNYTLFHREDGLVVGYLETESFAEALAGMDGTEVNERWQAEMASFFDLGERRPDQAMAPLEEFFHLA
jgi:L-rhamnose mutarotase